MIFNFLDRFGLVLNTPSTKIDNFSSWYLDTGCTTHMTGKRDWFVSLRAEGVGKVLIKWNDGKQSFIFGVLFMLGMKSNLLSLGQLLEKRFVMKMEDNVLKVYDNKKRLILKALLSKNITFKVGIDVMEHECLATTVRKSEWLCHYRFEHLNFKDLNLLHRDNMVNELPHIQVPN